MSRRITICRTIESLAPFELQWAKLVEHPETHPEVFKRLCEADKQIQCPFVVIELDNEDNILCMMIGRIEHTRGRHGGGYLPFPPPMARKLVFARGAIIGPDAPSSAPRLLLTLLDELDTGIAEMLELPMLRVDGPVHLSLSQAGIARFDSGLRRANILSQLTIETNFNAQLLRLGKSTRSTLRNNLNRFKREYQGRSEIRLYENDLDLDELISLSETVASQTYQRQLGGGFIDSPRQLAVYFGARIQKSLWGTVLLIDDKPAAFFHGIKLADTYFGTHTSSVRGMSHLPLGTILLWKTIELICNSTTHHSYWDFGTGYADYKNRYCDSIVPVEQRTIFGQSFRARRTRLLIKCFESLESGFKRVGDSTGFGLRIRTALRKRKTKRAQKNNPDHG